MSAGLSRWQRGFTQEDFEKNYLSTVDVKSILEMGKAQICVSKCKQGESIFNRATIMNQEAAGTFMDKCISKVGLKDFKGAEDPNMTKE